MKSDSESSSAPNLLAPSSSRALAERDQRRRAVRQIDVATAAEADEADALARPQRLVGHHGAADAARHQPGDLHHHQLATVRQAQPDALALVELACLLERGVE